MGKAKVWLLRRKDWCLRLKEARTSAATRGMRSGVAMARCCVSTERSPPWCSSARVLGADPDDAERCEPTELSPPLRRCS
eukprot:1119175-Rhodomonas_salina.1